MTFRPASSTKDMHIQGYAYARKTPTGGSGRDNGLTACIVYIHRESPLVPNTQRSLPLRTRHHTETSYEVIETGARTKGRFPTTFIASQIVSTRLCGRQSRRGGHENAH